MIILGIDPGSNTGFGIIETDQQRIKHRAHGVIKTKHPSFNHRILSICEQIRHILEQYQPNMVAIEQSFFHKNAQSALKLGQARGAIILTVMQAHLDIHEYAPRLIKSTVTGHGSADKRQVKKMISMRLNIPESKLTDDASDALAIAMCHIQHASVPSR